MPRPMSAGNAAKSKAEVTRPFYLAELDFSGGFQRATTAPFDMLHEGNTYIGVGRFGHISNVEEKVEGRIDKITLQLSGVDATLISSALGDTYQGRPGKLWKGWFDADWAVADPAELLFQGLIDTMPIKVAGGKATISVVIVSRFAKWENPRNQPRWSDEDHQSRRPGDKFFEFIPQLVAGQEVIWGGGGGAPAASTPSAGGGGRAPRGKAGG